ncbi:MAG: RteC domain-containing protein [Candidatus Pseudobacter hemicellulosilyticus]|uniref:RteC domain-containing protein n=1 Tax=Candidatus Pseudobacter hemicellulosilyticus TaxID=3121375 RepID=A0AAJ5WYI8_9BACT|nr:MAG: RteC domain-containing protein [Pseudobacter sp.]
MKEQFLALYQNMITEMEQCSQRFTTEKEQIEFCFQTCERNWFQLQQCLTQLQFSNDTEEIWFFKVLKPRFTALLEYYTLVYKAHLFLPDTDPAEVNNFWQKELRFAEKFFHDNSSFYQYYKSGDTELDELYFVRANNDPTQPSHRSYNINPQATTTHDPLLAALIARERYVHYVREKMGRPPEGHPAESPNP